MLSYRHTFHAGNFADVLKHLVLVRVLRYLTRKDKPLCYIDTHAGAGGYLLEDPQAQKTLEFTNGIAKLWTRDDLPGALIDYRRLVRAFNDSDDLHRYPGSPWLAAQLLRKNDRLCLFEAHSTDSALLQAAFAGQRNVRVTTGDGFQGCIGLMPPLERRGLVLMDPSYELKTDYQAVVDTLLKAHRRFATGVYAIWYPVVERNRIEVLERSVVASGIPRVQLFELGIRSDSRGYGMTACGMLVVNPPWGLRDEMELLLPYLANVLGEAGEGHYRIRELVGDQAGPVR